MNDILIQRLKAQLQLRSVNSVKFIYPDELLDMIECYDHCAEDFIEWLHDERLLKYIFAIKCGCGEISYVYESRLIRTIDDIYCSMCGNILSRDMIKSKGQLMYSLDRQSIMDFGDVSIKWKKRGYKENIIPIRTSEKMEEYKVEKKKIFIGSSKESIEDMNVIAALLDGMGAESRTWNSVTNPVFVAGDYTFERLLQVADEVDGALFIFNANDVTWYMNHLKQENTVRDNVLLEYGMFCGKKGLGKVAFVCKNKPRLASDLNGITYINGDGSESQIRMELSNWLKRFC